MNELNESNDTPQYHKAPVLTYIGLALIELFLVELDCRKKRIMISPFASLPY
jgi:hypothetical protein